MKTLILSAIISLMAAAPHGDGSHLHVGDAVQDFEPLMNTEGEMVNMASYPDANGYILIFSCNHCPFVIKYEDRIQELHETFGPQGYPVIAINPNDINIVPGDSYEDMQERVKEKGFTFDYVRDDSQEVAHYFGATRTPEVFLVENMDGQYILRYTGTIDDNIDDPSAVTINYVQEAVDAVEAGEVPNPDFTKAIGCTIKWAEK